MALVVSFRIDCMAYLATSDSPLHLLYSVENKRKEKKRKERKVISYLNMSHVKCASVILPPRGVL